MKTKITQFLFAIALFLSVNMIDPIGGPVIPPRQPSGPVLKSSSADTRIFSQPEPDMSSIQSK